MKRLIYPICALLFIALCGCSDDDVFSGEPTLNATDKAVLDEIAHEFEMFPNDGLDGKRNWLRLNNGIEYELVYNEQTGREEYRVSSIYLPMGYSTKARTIPASIGQLSYLKILRIIVPVGGTIPEEIFDCPLEILHICGEYNSGLEKGSVGALPASVIKCRDTLKDLTLTNLGITSIPEELGQMNQLETLNLEENEISGNIPEFLQNIIPGLTYLNLSRNKLTGEVPFFRFRKAIDLSENRLTSIDPRYFDNFPSPEGEYGYILDLRYNRIPFSREFVEGNEYHSEVYWYTLPQGDPGHRWPEKTSLNGMVTYKVWTGDPWWL